MIYAASFNLPEGIDIGSHDNKDGELVASTGSTDVHGITKTCKQIRAETLDLADTLLFQNTFKIDLKDFETRFDFGRHNSHFRAGTSQIFESPKAYDEKGRRLELYARAFLALLGDKAVSRVRHLQLCLGAHQMHHLRPGYGGAYSGSCAWLDLAPWVVAGFSKTLRHIPTIEPSVTFAIRYGGPDAFHGLRRNAKTRLPSRNRKPPGAQILRFEIPLWDQRGQQLDLMHLTDTILRPTFIAQSRRLRSAMQRDDFPRSVYCVLLQRLQVCREKVYGLAGLAYSLDVALKESTDEDLL
jgi:hypothetical protein